MLRPAITAAFLLIALLAPPAGAESADQLAAKRVISAQLDAFQADDASGAFSFASPRLQARFGTPATFLEMVKSAYAPVYRPRLVEFRDWTDSLRGPEQQVFVVGPDSRAYLAHYMMERQPDGSWRISGCYLEPLGEESV